MQQQYSQQYVSLVVYQAYFKHEGGVTSLTSANVSPASIAYQTIREDAWWVKTVGGEGHE